jgi:polyketide cyclase/dehydrase/lipid transport protein
MIKIERTITIHRTVDDVFAYVSGVEHGPQYISGQREAHQTSSGPMAVGTTFTTTGKFLRPGASNEITEYELNRRLAWKSASDPRSTTAWRFEPSGPSTRVTFTEVSEAAGLARLAGPMTEGMANSRVDRDLGTLKELLAASRPATTSAKLL